MPTSHHPWLLHGRSLPALLLLALIATLIPASPARAAGARTAVEGRVESRLMEQHDRARTSPWTYPGGSGYSARSRMTAWTDIREVARAWSDRMASERRLRHNPSYGSQYGDALKKAENVGYITDYLHDGTIDPEDEERWAERLMRMWMGSSGHRRNLMDRSFDEYGVGVAVVQSGRSVTVWATVDFRDYDGSSRTSSAEPIAGPYRGPTPDVLSPRDSCPSGRVPDARFRDLASGSSTDLAADCLKWWGITSGTAPGRFSPARTVTRGMMAAFIARTVRATDTPLPDGPNRFSDDNGHHFERDIEAVARAGIADGYGNGRFGPDDEVTRAQMAKFLDNAYAYVADHSPRASRDWFTDDVGLSLEPHVDKIAELGITTGFGEGIYGPYDRVRRDHMAFFLTRLLEAVIDEDPSLRP